MPDPYWAALPDAAREIVSAARARARGAFVAAAVVILVATTRGVAIYSALPAEVPTRWESSEGASRWSSSLPIRQVDKSFGTVLGPLVGDFVLLVVFWIVVRTGILTRVLMSFTYWLWGLPAPGRLAFEFCLYEEGPAYLLLGLSLTTALDAWQMWDLALGRPSSRLHVEGWLVGAAGPGVLVGLAVSLLFTWRRLRRALA